MEQSYIWGTFIVSTDSLDLNYESIEMLGSGDPDPPPPPDPRKITSVIGFFRDKY